MLYTRILDIGEVKLVVSRLKQRDSYGDALHLVIFRLSACCGLRCKEIRGIQIRDVRTSGARPHIQIRKEVTKGEKGKRKVRQVPLWWDADTLADLTAWKQFRLVQAEGDVNAPFVCCQKYGHVNRPISRSVLSRHWERTLTEFLGPERAKCLSIHAGRHSFASLCHRAGISLANIRDALGHSSLAITDQYLHATDDGVRDVFGG